MAIVVTAEITEKTLAKRIDSPSAGVATTLLVEFPRALVGGREIPAPPLKPTGLTKQYSRVVALAASTPIDVDLTAMTGGAGDADFTSSGVRLVEVRNLADPATESAKVLLVGGAPSNPWFAGFAGDASDKLKIHPGLSMRLGRVDANTTVSGAAKLLRLDPGANAFSVAVTVLG